jgi:hypothetical protein
MGCWAQVECTCSSVTELTSDFELKKIGFKHERDILYTKRDVSSILGRVVVP